MSLKPFSSIALPIVLVVMSGAAVAAAPAKKPAHPAAAPAKHLATLPPAAVRDWQQVDANQDHLIEPEEMEKYLAANPGPLKQQKS